MTMVFDIKTTKYERTIDIIENDADFAAANKMADPSECKACIYDCFTNDGIRDIFFIKTESKNYIALCGRSYVYGAIDHWSISKLFTVDKNEGNQIYMEIIKSKFISKKGKTFYKTNRF